MQIVKRKRISDKIREGFSRSSSQYKIVGILAIIWSEGEMVGVVRKIAQCGEFFVEISLHREGLDVFFGGKPQSDPRVAESAERLDFMLKAFKDEGFESTVLKTRTPSKPSGPACKNIFARINGCLYEMMQEELQTRCIRTMTHSAQ